jgi:peptidoglycan/xylan/chitin deacetylase (PgdA/CDA1 family)
MNVENNKQRPAVLTSRFFAGENSKLLSSFRLVIMKWCTTLPLVEEMRKLPPDVAKTFRTTSLKTITKPEWPRGVRCPVSLTFDLDGQPGWTAEGIEKLVPVTEGEYGPRVAIWRILDMLQKYKIKATFFVVGWLAENYPEAIKEIHKKGHELANHSWGHVDPTLMKSDEEEASLRKTNRIIEDLTGQVPKGYRAPDGEFSPNTIDFLRKVGIVYDGTCGADDIPYWWSVGGKTLDLLEIPFTWILDDAPHFLFSFFPRVGYGMKPPSEVFDLWSSEFDGLYKYGRSCVVCMHPEFIGRPSRMLMLERFIQHVNKFKAARFMRMIDVYNYWKEKYPPATQ